MSQTVLHTYAVCRDAIRSVDPADIVPKADRHQYTIEQVCVGGVVSIDSTYYRVVDISTYTGMDEEFKRSLRFGWKELKLLNLTDGKTTYVEWEKDDGLEVSLTTGQVALRDLQHRGERLNVLKIDDVADREESLWLSGVEYKYEDDYAARYARGSKGGRGNKAEYVYFWDFVSSSGICITIEGWRDGGRVDYEAYTSWSLPPNRIEIVSLKGT